MRSIWPRGISLTGSGTIGGGLLSISNGYASATVDLDLFYCGNYWTMDTFNPDMWFIGSRISGTTFGSISGQPVTGNGFALLGYAGAGLGFGFTNAISEKEILGMPFQAEIDAGQGVRWISGSAAFGPDGTYQLLYGPPASGIGYGALGAVGMNAPSKGIGGEISVGTIIRGIKKGIAAGLGWLFENQYRFNVICDGI